MSLLLLFPLSTLPVAYAQEEPLHIDGPDPLPQECGSATFTFSGGVPPYTLEIKNATDQPPLRIPLNASNDTTFTWSPIDLREGAELLAEVKDSVQKRAFTDIFTVQSGDDSCPISVSTVSSLISSTSSRDSASSILSVPTPSLSSTPSTTTSSPSSSSSVKSVEPLSAGAIAGIAVVPAILILLVAGTFFYLRRRKASQWGTMGLLRRSKPRDPSSKSPKTSSTSWDATIAEGCGFGISNVPTGLSPAGDPDTSPSGLQTPTNSSLVARASSRDSLPLDRVTHLSPCSRSNDEALRSEKLMRELRSRAVLNPALGEVQNQVNIATEHPMSFNQRAEHRRGPRYETDGGVRLAGGRMGETIAEDFDQYSVSEGSTLPPPYSSDFGEL